MSPSPGRQPGAVKGNFDQSALEPYSKTPQYDDGRALVHGFIKKALPTAVTPEEVADAVLRAATTPRHRLRYPVGKEAKQVSLLRRLVPARLFGKALRQQFGLPA